MWSRSARRPVPRRGVPRRGVPSAVVAVLAAAVLGGCGAGLSADDDRELAHCLSPAQQQRLVEAASALGIVAPGRAPATVSVDGVDVAPAAWRGKDRDGFDRACAAIAPSAGSDTLVNGLLSLANVLAGGLVALGSTVFVARATRRRQAAAAVREATGRLVRSVDALVRQRSGRTDTAATGEAVAERVVALDVALRTARSLGRAVPVTPAVEALDRLSELLTASWPDRADDARFTTRADAVRAAAAEVDRSADRAADALTALPWKRAT